MESRGMGQALIAMWWDRQIRPMDTPAKSI